MDIDTATWRITPPSSLRGAAAAAALPEPADHRRRYCEGADRLRCGVAGFLGYHLGYRRCDTFVAASTALTTLELAGDFSQLASYLILFQFQFGSIFWI